MLTKSDIEMLVNALNKYDHSPKEDKQATMDRLLKYAKDNDIIITKHTLEKL